MAVPQEALEDPLAEYSFDYPADPFDDNEYGLPRSVTKELFGPSGLLGRPVTNEEIKKLHTKQRKGFGRWVGKVKDAAGEFKVASERVLGDLIERGGRFPDEVTRDLYSQINSNGLASEDATAVQATPAIGMTGRMIGIRRVPNKVSSSGSPVRIPSEGYAVRGPRDHGSSSKLLPSISLSPTIQARLFSELELLVARNLNEYLLSEQMKGHLSATSVDRIIKRWTDDNRPLPTDFYFDFGTQLEFLHANSKNLQFHGEYKGSLAVIQSMLKASSGLAKRLTRKTLCTPDSDIRMHLTDIGNMFKLIGIELDEWNKYNYWCRAALNAIEVVKRQRADDDAAQLPPYNLRRRS